MPSKIQAIVASESIAGVSENMASVATGSFLLGMLEVGSLDLKCFLMGNLVEVTAHLVKFQKHFLMISALTQPK